mmetsp:Transcript_44559/g.100647  ORF Transcript_44559/g.100647 Transcript_44559/m.100647 type:complete len:259 (-) Transcript_44559:212-988(-)
MRSYAVLALVTFGKEVVSLVVNGIDIPHARESGISRALDNPRWPDEFPYTARDLTPTDPSDDQLFYLVPRFGHHAGSECRAALTQYYDCVLPRESNSNVLDLCSSWTSHYPNTWKSNGRCAALGLNPIELAVNPSKTEWRVQNLNKDPRLPYGDGEFDLITNSLSVDYMTKPLELFREMYRVLKPGGLCAMAFTNRCFPSKVVPVWFDPYSDYNHAKVVGNYFHFSENWANIEAVDVSPPGRVGQIDPMYIVQANKPL